MKELHFNITYIIGLIVEAVIGFIAFLWVLDFVDFILRCIYQGFSWLCDRFFFALPITIIALFVVPMWFVFKNSVGQVEDEDTENVDECDDITKW